MGSWSDHPLVQLTLARLREFYREPGAIFWTFGFPVLLAIGLGIAFRARPPEKAHVALVDGDAGRARVEEILARADSIDLVVLDATASADGLRTGRIDLLVRAPEAGDPPRVTYRYDPMRPQGRSARLEVDEALQRGLGRVDSATTAEETVSEPGSRYVDFLIPGLVGLNVMGSSMWGIGYAVVHARSRRLLKRMAATPMRRSHYLLSFMLSRLLFLVAEVAALVAFGRIVFGVRVHGSLATLGVVSVVGAMAFLGLALLIAARPQSTEVAAGWMNFVMLPMYVLSGAFFSYERFPEIVHPVLRALPLTAFCDALRAVMGDGASLWGTWPELAVLAAWGLVSFVLALRFFRWQ